MVILRFIILLLVIVTPLTLLSGQNFTVSGYITDMDSGETLVGANVIAGDKGVSSNIYGFYSLTIPGGRYEVTYSYLGYTEQIIAFNLKSDTTINIRLQQGLVIEEVVISSSKDEKDKNVQSTEMGTVELPVDKIKKLPAVFGEVDILKTIQLLPGVMSGGEGTSGFYVRGGGPDQNLILLDEAVVYNSGHLLGFFSVFNADAIKNTTLIKGGMPANYGGRLSSVLDIHMKEGNNQHYSVKGGIGLVSSRLTVEGPIIKDKSSFMVSGRRTYIGDLVQPLINDTDFDGTNYYFYDLNAKINYRFGQKDRIFFSAYFGRDVLNFRYPKRDFFFDLPYGNTTSTLRWNHLFSDKLFFNFSAIYNDYQFEFDGGQEDFVFRLFSGVEDWNLKMDFDYYPSPQHNLKFGINYTNHTLTPNTASASNGEVDFNTDFIPKYAHDIGVYILDNIRLNEKFSINLGIRYVLFSQLGPYTSKLDGSTYGAWDPVTTYSGLEPRVNFKYAFNPSTSLKGGYVYTNQFLHLVSNSSTTLPTDVWVPSTEIVKPQQSSQYAIGLFKNFIDNQYETSVELYYRHLNNQIDYADDYVDDFSQEVEESFVFGTGRAYGIEFFGKKSTGRWNGWIGYTLSRSERSFPDIESGRTYPAVYDRLHDLSIVSNYAINKKWELGTAFIYGSGRYFTPVSGFFFIEQNLNVFYGPRNSQRLQDYHRLDLSLTWTPHPDTKKNWKSSWTFSIYNVYNRKNPFFINYDFETNFNSGSSTISGEQITIFPMIPSITYNFSWK